MEKLRFIIVIALVGAVVFGAERYGDEKTKREPVWPNKVWGEAFKSVALSVSPMKEKYKLGDKIEISVVVKNLGDEELVLTYDVSPKRRMVLFDEEGRPVEKKQTGKLADKKFSNRPDKKDWKRVSSGRVNKVPPSGTFPRPIGWNLFTLNDWFKIDKGGTYTLVMMQQISLEDTDFLISNLSKIKIVGPDSDKTEKSKKDG